MHKESVSITASVLTQYACQKASSCIDWYSQTAKKHATEGRKGKKIKK